MIVVDCYQVRGNNRNKNRNKTIMNRIEIKKIIKENVTIQIASDWYHEAEKLMHFDYGFNGDFLGISCTNEPDRFDYALDLFENQCEKLLTGRNPLPAKTTLFNA